MTQKKILVLDTLDERGAGHGWAKSKIFELLGHNVEFICLLRQNGDTLNFFIDGYKKDIKYYLYKICRKLEILTCPFSVNKATRSFYRGIDFATANGVLKKMTIKPDHILICSYHHFLSPKSIYKLWKITGAEITISMVDNKILGGGCAYPINCIQYEKGCPDCQYYPWYAKFFASRVYKEKVKYFSQIPLHLTGSSYDLIKTEKVSYLKGKCLHPVVNVPTIPFIKDKKEARLFFNLRDDSFVILAGAVNPQNIAKGFSELKKSLFLFSERISANRKVEMVIIGKNIPEFDLPENISVVAPGYQDMQGLYTAYYACDLYVSPSIEDSGPMMVNYAIACGRPVVAFPVGSALDLVIHKETGWIASRGNCEEYANGINWFYNLTDNQLGQMEKKCKEHINSYKTHQWYEYMLE